MLVCCVVPVVVIPVIYDVWYCDCWSSCCILFSLSLSDVSQLTYLEDAPRDMVLSEDQR